MLKLDSIFLSLVIQQANGSWHMTIPRYMKGTITHKESDMHKETIHHRFKMKIIGKYLKLLIVDMHFSRCIPIRLTRLAFV